MSVRVSMSSALDLGLLGAHVLRRADHAGRSCGEQRLLGRAADRIALATPKSMTFGTGSAVVHRHQDVRRLEVAMDDALLVRVLDGLADLRRTAPAARAVGEPVPVAVVGDRHARDVAP